MTKQTKTDLKKRALMAVRDYGVNLTLFRNAMSEWDRGRAPIRSHLLW